MNDESDKKNPLRAFTQAGRVLVVISMIFGAAVFYFSIDQEWFSPGLYLFIVLLLPGFAGALTLFCVGCIVYRFLGIRVWAVPSTNPTHDPDAICPTTDE